MNKLNFLTILITTAFLFFPSCKKDEEITAKVKKTDAISFEEITLNENGYYNGSDGSGGFTTGNAVFKTNYNTEYQSWSGFAVSSLIDTVVHDISNQYSTIAGASLTGSKQFALLYSYSADTIEFITPAVITNIGFSNSTFAYYAMKDGNYPSKKFGGPTGKDPDYFDLYISTVDSIGVRRNFSPIPLADFTFDSDSLDYISKKWEYYNLSNAGYVKYLIFSFSSSDTSALGINTPTYVCIDNIIDEWEE